MKESARAARDEIAHNRCVAALKALASEGNEKVAELEDLRMRRLPAPVSSMMEREIMADVLEGLHKAQVVRNFTAALERTRVPAEPAVDPPLEQADSPAEPAVDPPIALGGIVEGDVVDLLKDAGYNTVESIANASDKDLLDIKGIGPAKLAEIREAVG